MRILLAEDDPKLLKSLIHIFRNNRYITDGVSNGADAFNYAETGEYDGIVMDIMMPEKDGLMVLRELREQNITTPVLLLTARTEIPQRIEGLDEGADDYLPKPFAAAELMARVRAMLRRKSNYTPDILSVGSTVLDRGTLEVSCREKTASLSAREFQILEIMMQNPRVIIPAEQLMTHIWGWDSNVDMGVIWVHISNLRKKIGTINAPITIKFIRNAGYMLEEI
ncbi:MAG TPA: response regulator transcription factor [Candidatus Fimisoma avicola]|uniref:Stage 0 sporulation protein A homolog n=1 Tax=Candidatus Fimisoma avicola TaxID=2840826 RepID=A0A9D1L6Y7_9FIRM|nr:response regulator transcription factor [Candidatus Fimisoma avicola]